MIRETYFEQKAIEYCRVNDIRLLDGKVSQKYVQQIQMFLKAQEKLDRNITAEKEEKDRLIISGDTILKALGQPSVFESPIEEFMWNGLRNNELSKYVEIQYEIGKYRVDLAFPIAKLIVECDGREYHFTEKSQIERDQKRDKYLSRKGWRIIHIEGVAIRRNIVACVDQILNALKPFVVT